jgi:hypothetical protein
VSEPYRDDAAALRCALDAARAEITWLRARKQVYRTGYATRVTDRTCCARRLNHACPLYLYIRGERRRGLCVRVEGTCGPPVPRRFPRVPWLGVFYAVVVLGFCFLSVWKDCTR